VSATAEWQRFARIALSFVTEPGDLVLGGLLRCCEPAEIVVALSSGDDPATVLPARRSWWRALAIAAGWCGHSGSGRKTCTSTRTARIAAMTRRQ
jgi:hypothetical protein